MAEARTDADGDAIMTEKQTPKDEVDEKLYSRQLYVMGHEAMKQMQKSNVLICGMNGLGIEIAKNAILAGVKSVSIFDPTLTTIRDLGSQFYLSQDDIGKPRGESCINDLQELNRYVSVRLIKSDTLSDELILQGNYSVVVMVGYPLSDQIRYNKICHSNNIGFIATEACGVFGYVFVDFGEAFLVKDQNGEQPLSGIITHVSNEKPAVVQVHEDQRHGLSSGDFVKFEEIEGMEELNNTESAFGPIKVLSPYTFEIPVDATTFKAYTGEGMYFQEKQAATLTFKSLEEQLSEPSFLMSDFTKDPSMHHLFYRALNQFRDETKQFPNPGSNEDANRVVAIAKELAGEKQEFDEKLFFKLARCSSAVINPMAAALGGIVGQEILKACSSKFTPIQQIFYFDAAEALVPDAQNVPLSSYAPKNSRYDDQIAVFGVEIQEQLLNARMFLVGAGAIGCEMLKNWALMGVGCGKEGHVTVTDMDFIEASNLNRQFLFRNKDLTKAKSITAAKAARVMNPDLNITAHENRVGEASENIYDNEFWSSLTAVCTALDNVQARLYVDAQCVNYKKPLLESGTLGTKGNTQIVVPHMTESYGSTRDPPEKDIPICTLKNFPNKIEHTIQWARDDFEGVFKQAPEDVNRFVKEENFLADLAKDSSNEKGTLQRLNTYLVTEKPLKFEDCVHWARIKFELQFNHQIRQLLHNFPKDATTAEGTKFWSGPKRAPDPVLFDLKDETHAQFIIAASNLRAVNFGLKGTSDLSVIESALKSCKVPPFIAKEIKIATTDEEAKEMKENTENTLDDDYDATIAKLKASLPERSDISGYQLTCIEFEKDDDTNFHMDYITACSNLRARNYHIKEANKHETKGIAGKIIPAIATTTALVTGLISLEFFKVLQCLSSKESKKIEDFRNAYVNLAVPLCAMSEPAPCGETTIQVKGKDWSYSLWDKIEIENGGNMRLQDLIEYFDKEWGLELSMLSYGSAILYAFFHSPAKQNKRKPAKLRKLVEAVTKVKLNPNKKYLLFEVGLSDENDEDIEVPTVRVHIG